MPDKPRSEYGVIKLSDAYGRGCCCEPQAFGLHPRCPIHAHRPNETCRVCGGVNGQHYSQCPEDPWR